MTTQKSMTDALIPGDKYDVKEAVSRFAGFAKEGSTLGRHLHGYNVYDYFDADGRYLGVDSEGVEPMFYPAE